jgi:hypothetical protein
METPCLGLETIRQLTAAAGIDPAALRLADSLDALPALEWIRDVFAPAWRQHRDQVLGFPEAEAADCDDYARACADFAALLHRKTSGHPRAGLAFGQFWFTRHTGTAHAINVAICRDPAGALHLVFFEPQTAELVALTPEEVSSCDLFCF